MNKHVGFTGLMTICLSALATHSHADGHYDYEIVEYPGTASTSVFGVNDRGDAVGNGSGSGLGPFPFIYSTRNDLFTDVALPSDFDELALIGNSDSGVMTGSVFDADAQMEYGVIVDKTGVFTVFQHPDAVSFTQGRDVSNKGLVSGIYNTEDGSIAGFVYDPKEGTFSDTNDPPALATIAHGINAKGEIVGNSFFEGDPCGSDAVFVSYSWKRGADGSLIYFTVNGLPTRARGISDDGTITGFIFDGDLILGFVTELGDEACQEITIADSELLQVPGFTETLPEGITNSGTVVGVVNTEDGQLGFVARPN